MRALSVSTRSTRLLGTALSIGLVATPAALVAGTPGADAVAPPEAPGLRVFTTTQGVTEVRRPAGQRVYLSLPAYVTPTGGTFDLKVARADFASPIAVTQVVHQEGGGTAETPLPGVTPTGWRGLPEFFDLTVTDGTGAVVRNRSVRFCPNGYEQQRIDPDGADRTTFPSGCYGMPFTYGSRWGIDEGWAASVGRGVALRVPRGRYEVSMSITDTYREIWGIPEDQATATATFRVRNGPFEDVDHEHRASSRPTTSSPRRRVPVVTTPPSDDLPDLRTLPAFGIGTRHSGGKDWLAFGANIWVGGTSVLDIEGFRRADEEVMDAWQYFYDGDEVTGRAAVGQMEYDTRRGHHHWHLLQFAQYRLLDAGQQHVTNSRKQSFCIVPTDPVDLSLDDAERRPYATGLDSACGSRSALWIRETLPVGWGDTYYQSRGGQAFNISRVPNGRYFISVEANPTRELFESDLSNNESLREVILTGKPGARRVCVPAVHGLDGHGRCGPGQG